MKFNYISLSSLIIILSLAPTAWSQNRESSLRRTPSTRTAQPYRLGTNQVEGGIGFTLDPDTFMLDFQWLHFIDQQIGIGPLFQLMVDDNIQIFSTSLAGRWVMDLERSALHPMVESSFGLALGLLDLPANANGDDDDLSFILQVGGGLELDVAPNVSVNTILRFALTDIFDDNFITNWRIIGLTWKM